MAEGEFESMKALRGALPELVPRPIGWGTYESDENIHFFLCEFVDLYDELPDVVDFCSAIAEMHQRSMTMTRSDNSMYGFHVPTCNETVEQYSTWNASWECFFTESLKLAFELEERVHGPDPEILELQPALLEKVCPRLLRPLETEGRNIRPCLVHGDLWDGNIAVRARSGKPVIFDASALWAHNEYELHIWRGTRYRIGRTFMKEYFHHFPISPPEDDWADRNLLYSIMADLHSSTHFRRTERFRSLLVQSMKDLILKYPNGYQGTAKRKDAAQHPERNTPPAKPARVTLGGYANQ
jgi:protein-ribulosamine 3-kinase